MAIGEQESLLGLENDHWFHLVDAPSISLHLLGIKAALVISRQGRTEVCDLQSDHQLSLASDPENRSR
jgi:hypothetical protein